MKIFDILSIEDLRLIVAIIDEGSLTKGAKRMRMSQSNASYALKKIQNLFQKDLFIRKGRILIPSEYGWHVYRHVKNMLNEFEKLAEPPIFDPKIPFTLDFAATEYEVTTILPPIVRLVRRHAPKAQIKIVSLDVANMRKQIEKVDFLFVPQNISSEKIASLKIMTDNNIVFYDSEIRDAPSSISEFVRAKHAIVSFGDVKKTYIDSQLSRRGLRREIALTAFSFAALASLIRGTDLITTLPASFASGLFSGFGSCECPLALPPMPLFMCWDATREESGKLRWFRNLLTNNKHFLAHLNL